LIFLKAVRPPTEDEASGEEGAYMTNPDADPLDAVEAYLKGLGGRWALIVSSLDESIRTPQP
jgi:hypothetical protein